MTRLRRQASHALGVGAEERCAEVLKAKGYTVLGLRVRTKGGEVDILARTGDTLVLVEVKARKTAEDALYAITPAKMARQLAAAEALLAGESKIGGLSLEETPNIRFDVMAVSAGAPPLHLEDAWRP